MDGALPDDPETARAVQGRLRGQVRLEPLDRPVSRVGGVDSAFLTDRVVAVVVVLRYPELEVVEEAIAALPIPFPYVPGLLSFREGPAILEAFQRLHTLPDLLLFDGQGIAHPRRLGIASHMGLLLDRPAVGVAKSRLVGTYDAVGLGVEKGDRVPLMDGGETLGTVLRSRRNVRPLFVSPGHRCNVTDAVSWTLACCTRYRLPEPTRIADKRADVHKRQLRERTDSAPEQEG
ncbi:deoxyribonuclease V [Thiohalorhabdus methylotrophus]|uniref:Endonuclease V n=1 Tax=Thiohalorhabdus methylotrophus TaxID=3242694 RepID=A0ABV4TW20_9GAMM